MQRTAVALDDQGIIAAAGPDRGGHAPGPVQGVGGDGGTEEVEHSNHLQGGRDLAAAGRPALGQHQALVRRPGRDQVQRRRPGARLAGAGEGLAVDRHDRAGEPRAARQALGEGGREAAERHLERHRVEKAEDAAERVVARDPVRQGQKLPQKGLLGAAEQRHVAAGLGPAQGRREGDDQDLRQIVTCVAGPRVRHARKRLPQALHGRPPGANLEPYRIAKPNPTATPNLKCDSPAACGERPTRRAERVRG